MRFPTRLLGSKRQTRDQRVQRTADRRARRRMLFESLEARHLLAAVSWTGGAGNLLWSDPANWSTNQLPGIEDDVTIDAPGNVTIVYDQSDSTTINSLSLADSLRLSSGSIDVIGEFSTTPGTTLSVVGSGVEFVGRGATTIDGAVLTVNSGGRLSLPSATSYVHGPGGNSRVTLRASGSGSILDLSGMQEITGATAAGQLNIEAQAGGEIDLSRLVEIIDPEAGSGQGRAIRITADGESSLVNLASLQSFQDRTPVTGIGWGPGYSALIARNSGEIVAPVLASLSAVEIQLDGTGTLPIDQITTLTNGYLNIIGGDYTFSSLAVIDGTSMVASSGGRLSLPSATSFAHGVGGNSTVTLRSNGQGSQLDLSNLQQIAAATGVGHIAIEAEAGGVIDLSRVLEIVDPEAGNGQGRSVRVTADGESSLINLASVQSFQDRTPVTGIGWGPGYSALIVKNGGEIAAPVLTSLTAVQIQLDGTGTLPTDQITTLTNGFLDVSGGDYTFPSLTTADGTTMTVSNGGRLSLPAVTSYSHLAGGNSTATLRASGVGSLLGLGNVEQISGATGVGHIAIEAQAGGEIDVSGVIEIIDPEAGNGQGRSVRVTADGESSLINLMSLQSFHDRTPVTGIGWGPGYSALIVKNGGEIVAPVLTSLTAVQIQLDGTGTLPTDQITTLTNGFLDVSGGDYTLPSLTTADGTTMTVSNGGRLSLPAVTSYSHLAGGNSTATLRASGVGSLLGLGHVEQISGATGVGHIAIEAEAGGVIDLSRVLEIIDPEAGSGQGRSVRVTADGPNSRVDLASLESFRDRTPVSGIGWGPGYSALIPRNYGQITLGDSTSLTNVELLIDTSSVLLGGEITLESGSILTGVGNVFANVTNVAGTVRPNGDSSGLTIHGNYSQSAAGRLQTAINGTIGSGDYSRLIVRGQASLGGSLEINRPAAFVPDFVTSYDVITAETIQDNFHSVDGLEVDGGDLQLQQGSSVLALSREFDRFSFHSFQFATNVPRERVFLDVTELAEARIELRVYDPLGSLVMLSNSTADEINRGDSGPFLLEFQGEYEVRVFSELGLAPQYSASINVAPLQVRKANYGQLISGDIFAPGQTDVWEYDVRKGDSIEFATEGRTGANEHLSFTMRDANRRAIFHSTSTTDDAAGPRFGPFVAQENGVYTITVNGVGEATSAYQFRVSGIRPPHIWANSLRGTELDSVNEAWFFFDQPMDTASFSLEQDILLLRTPLGNLQATGFRWENPKTLVVTFTNQSLDSQVQVTLASTITNEHGLKLDQNRNGIPGQSIEDRYSAVMTHDSQGPYVIGTIPSLEATLPIDQITFQFNEPIDNNSFSLLDVLAFTGPDGDDLRAALIGYEFGVYTLTLNFASLQDPGDYSITIGSSIRDVSGNLMDQSLGFSQGQVDRHFTLSFKMLSPLAADLSVKSVSLQPEAINFGSDVLVTYEVENRGAAAASGGWIDRIYLSSDDRSDVRDVVLATIIRDSDLVPGESYTESASVAISASSARFTPGEWQILVRTDVSALVEEQDTSNNVTSTALIIESNVAHLASGVTLERELVGHGAVSLFQLDVENSSPLSVILDHSRKTDRTEVYLRRGQYPTRSDYDFRHSLANSSDHQIVVPNANAGTWFVAVYGSNVPSPATFQITATASDVSVLNVSPNIHPTGQLATLTFSGAGFLPGTTVSLQSTSGLRLDATTVEIDSFSRLTTTFDLSDVPIGDYDAIVYAPSGNQDKLANALTVIESGLAQFESRLILPGVLLFNAPATLYVEYENTGTAAMDAPILILQSADPEGDEFPILSLDQTSLTTGFWASNLPVGFAHSVQIYASGATPGILNPGEKMRVPVYYAGILQPWNLDDRIFEFELRIHGLPSDLSENPEQINWDERKDSLRPDWIENGAWDIVHPTLAAEIGGDWSDYIAMLSRNLAFLRRIGRNVEDVTELFAFELQKAVGFSAIPTITSAIDASFVSRSLALEVGRSFGGSILDRFTSGPFGQGWRTSWNQSLVQDSDGAATLQVGGRDQLRFLPDRRDEFNYVSPLGFEGSLRRLASGAFVLRNANGNIIRFQSTGKLNYFQDTNGNRLTAEYTSDQLTRFVHTNGEAIAFQYNSSGLISSITDVAGRVSNFTYDPTNTYLLSVSSPSGTFAYTYEVDSTSASRHALTSITDPTGTTRVYEYDERGRLAATYLNSGAERITFSYGTQGQITTTDASGVFSRQTFDHHGALARSEESTGKYLIYNYDSAGRLVDTTNPFGQSQSLQWSRRGTLASMTDEIGNVFNFATAGSLNQLSLFADALDNRTHYSYDVSGNLTSTTYADGSLEQLQYDATGNVIQWVNRRGQAIQFEYNTLGQLTTETFPDGTTNRYSYDGRNRLQQVVDHRGATIFTYNDADQLARVEYPGSRWIEYSYDAAGRRTVLQDYSGHMVRYEYDAAGRLARLAAADHSLIVAYSYDTTGRLIRKDKANGTYSLYEYDHGGRIQRITHFAPDDSVNSFFAYTYDALGQRNRMTTQDGSWTYAYDLLGQLTRAVFQSNNPEIADQDLLYVYDAMGNRVRTEINGTVTQYKANALNQYTSVGRAEYEYDLDGNLTTVSRPDYRTVYIYDSLNRLTKRVKGDDEWLYEYDVLGNRGALTVNGERTEYLADLVGVGSVIREYKANNEPGSTHVHAFQLEASVLDDTKLFNDFDILGSISGITDISGGYVNAYSYLPFGEALFAIEGISSDFSFLGAYGVFDSGNGLSHVRARHYDAALGRFVSPDAYGTVFDLNVYRYGRNNPTRFIDIDGYQSFEVGVFGALGGGGGVNINVGPQGFSVNVIVGVGLGAGVGVGGSDASPGSGGAGLIVGAGGVVSGPGGLSLGGAVTTAVGGGGDVSIDGSITVGPSLGAVGGFIVGIEIPWSPGVRPTTVPSPDTPGDDGGGGEVPGALAIDPNEKFGAAGYGDGAFVRAGATIPYIVHFENLGPGSELPDGIAISPATAPAQRVEIRDQLSQHLDWGSFEFSAAGFGDQLLSIPPGLQYYVTTVPFSYNGIDFEVEVEFDFDASSGLVKVVFQSIDTETLLPPEGLTGLLPPEDGTGIGQGYFSFTIQARADLATGTEIRNVAQISFDFQEPIATNQIHPQRPELGTDPSREALNTIDAYAPSSLVASLPATVSTESFHVSWSGQDDAVGNTGSGIRHFDIFVSVNDEPFQPWLSRTSDTSAQFPGQSGNSYAFYSVATDNVGFQEQKQPIAEASTSVVAGAPWQNPIKPEDVNDDSAVTPIDALIIINYLNRAPAEEPTQFQAPFMDVNGNGSISPIDALVVINYLNRQRLSGEGEENLVFGPSRSELDSLPSSRQSRIEPADDDETRRLDICRPLTMSSPQLWELPERWTSWETTPAVIPSDDRHSGEADGHWSQAVDSALGELVSASP